jgi:ATP-dependent DNA helicase DinG
VADYIDEVFASRTGLLAQRFPEYQERSGQVDLTRQIDRTFREGGVFLGEAPCGCHVAGQPILLYDGSIKLVEDVAVGDRLMGPDGPRTVLALARGEQETVEVRPLKGKPWRVNLDHILTLVRCDNDRVIDVRVREWLDWSRSQKALHKLFRAAVDFRPSRSPLPLDPYFLGVLLGDGTLGYGGLAITKGDEPIVAVAHEQAAAHGMTVRTRGITHHLSGRAANGRNPIIDKLRALDLFPSGSADKFIPDIYKTAKATHRLELLAGLLDTDGSLTGGSCYDFVSKSERLAEDLAFVARSLGFAAYVKSRLSRCQTGHEGTYYRLTVSGETSRIPCRIPRKKAPARRQNKDVCRVGFDAVRTGSAEPYFGFSLDGDGRYLLGDFTVTHNTGKSFAAGVPAVYHASQGRRVVIATANIALQEQLDKKDLPFLADLLPWPFKFSLIKGRQNYACLKKVEELSAALPPSLLPDDNRELRKLLDWARSTTTGDASELPQVPRQAAWREISVGPDDCLGSRCSHADNCYSNRARSKAADVDIAITNHHIAVTNASLAEKTGQDLILPSFDALIVDESHELPDIARDVLGWQLTEGTFRRLAREAGAVGLGAADELRGAAGDLFQQIGRFGRSPQYKTRLRRHDAFEMSTVTRALGRVADHATRILEKGGEGAPVGDERQAELDRIRKRAKRLGDQLADLGNARSGDAVSIEFDQQGRPSLKSTPVDIGPFLQRTLFARTRTTCLISATLTTGGTFDFIKRELGLTGRVPELRVDSPFDFWAQGLLIVPSDMPEPRDPGYLDALAEKVAQVIEASQGRTLGLFTSYKALDHVYNRVAGGRYRVLKQGDLPKTQLIDAFRKDTHSVLLGTTSLWTGVDVPGEALSSLVIDKLPFPRLDDPVLDVLGERDGKAAFGRHHLPRCMMTLQQGVGRLIRSVSDRGVVVLLDRRLLDKPYGRQILSSLPKMARGSLDAIPTFLAGDPDAWAS